MRRFLWLWIAVAALMLAACGGTSPDAPTPTATSRPDPTAMPTPSGWVTARTAITQEDVSQFTELGRLEMPEPPSTVFAYALSLDNTLMAGLNNDFLIVWDLVTGKSVFGSARQGANMVFFGPDRTEVYTATGTGELRVFDVERGINLATLQILNGYNSTWAYDPIGGWLAFGSDRGSSEVWDMTTRTVTPISGNSDAAISTLAFNPQGTSLAIASTDGTLRLYDFLNKREVIRTDSFGLITQAAFAPSGDKIAINSANGGVLLIDSDTLAIDRQLTSGSVPGIFAFLGQTNTFVLGGQTGDITLWDAETGRLAATLPGTTGRRPSTAVAPQGDMLFTSTRESSTLWNIGQLASGAVLRGGALLPQTDILRVIWTSDGLQVLLFEALGPIRVFGIP